LEKCKRKPAAVAPNAFGAVSAENSRPAASCAEDSARYNTLGNKIGIARLGRS
jgi:hypothetical protein